MNKQILYICKQEDRDAICVILARNGYVARQGREKKSPKGTVYLHYVEYWKE